MDGRLITECQQSFESAGLRCDRELLCRLVSSLLTKRFVILTGLAGSGKTKLAQGFAQWLCSAQSSLVDPFRVGAEIPSTSKTYHVMAADSLAVEFWNGRDEKDVIKVTLPRALIQEWVDHIRANEISDTTPARQIRDSVGASTKYSTQLNSFESNLKAAAFAAVRAPAESETSPRVAIVPVGADWTSNENVLGYPNGLDSETYVSTPTLELIVRAIQDPGHPYFLILDEMNLSHVERYFADVLSAIESGEPIILHGDERRSANDRIIPPKISLPDNLFIIGTVNIDETTYMFSPKVLDRANVIEFRVTDTDLSAFLKDPRKPDMGKISGAGIGFGRAFVDAARVRAELPDRWNGEEGPFSTEMKLFFDVLSGHGAEFGFRVAHEAARFVSVFDDSADPGGDVSFDDAFDCVIVQKFLPKLHGSRAKLGPLLKSLWFLCTKKHSDRGDNAVESSQQAARSSDKDAEPFVGVPAHAPYPLSAHKIGRMWRLLNENGYVSFAEA